MTTGIYISVPFCRSKCSYCNFASGVFSRERMQKYADRVCTDVAMAEELAEEIGGVLDRQVDTIYLGGGTPSTLEPQQLAQLFAAVRGHFNVLPSAEITVECAPGTISDAMLETLLQCGVNRVSLGVQSFIDLEARAVGRLHDRKTTLDDIVQLRAAGVSNINVDLIAGLPHQTDASWDESVATTIETGTPHVSVYMLEVDEDSRLGRELIAGGTRYHAHHVPDDALTAELYSRACERLNVAGIAQYEISNFACKGFESKHNLKYWTRQPYLGFGLDAHSMLPAKRQHSGNPNSAEAVRFSTADELEVFLAASKNHSVTSVTCQQAIEEEIFLGLRLNQGIDVREMIEHAENETRPAIQDNIKELTEAGLLENGGSRIRLTHRGRLLSNDVFARFVELK